MDDLEPIRRSVIITAEDYEALKTKAEERDLAIWALLRYRGRECEFCKNCQRDISICEIYGGECENCEANCKCHICDGCSHFEFNADAARMLKGE